VDRIVAIAATRPDVSLRYLEQGKSFADVLSPSRGRDPDFRDFGAEEEPTAESWTSALTAIRIVGRI
jgi:hypothetical protein